jgi:hypothetical protein
MYDEANLAVSVVCPDCGYRPHKATGPTAAACVDDITDEISELWTRWERALVDNLSRPEIQDQIRLLDGSEKVAVETLLADNALPAHITDDLVKGVNRAFNRFAVRRISPEELWVAIFPAPQPSTLGELRERFRDFLTMVQNGDSDDRVRVLPAEGGAT